MKLWKTACALADRTSADRNRYIDLLRVVAISLVVGGHWLMCTASYDHNTHQFTPVDLLVVAPTTQWLTGVFQVMPIFFIVGGYANAASLARAKQKKHGYGDWLANRLHRLITPLLPLVAVWLFASILLPPLGVATTTLVFASQAALVPTWFLAIYTLIALLAPISYACWCRWGWASLAVLMGLASLMDSLFFLWKIRWPSWSNYVWVWLTVHHLGFAWFDRRLSSNRCMLWLSMIAFGALAALIAYGPYPLALAGSPDSAISNSFPPKISLILLGIAQFGVLYALESPVRQWLAKSRLWASVIFANSIIITVYLWHMTLLMAVFGVLYFLNGWGLELTVGTTHWWVTRIPWLAFLAILLLPLALGLSRFEHLPPPIKPSHTSVIRQILGALLTALGIAFMALNGLNGDLTATQSIAPMLVFVGAYCCGIKPLVYRPSV